MSPIRLAPADAERFAALRLRMLNDAPWAFFGSPDNDQALDIAHLNTILAQEHNVILAVEAPSSDVVGHRPALVAAAGLARGSRPKFFHRATLWGVFVEPEHRGKGVATTIIAAALDLARSWDGVDYVDLGVSENATVAQGLYERFGFHAWGREPETTEYNGRRYDEIFMTLKL